ncbi:hypothetical protein FEK33_17525 [Nocardia asteroides NBRC 15531]|uniref:Uncharacterized protein n=1 Tax=Nocardia asteroides NBRC 15531 TaxID=1110697 RepID=U5EAC0_NOCAS|nr:hypothetical protein [Nocardia asteroides]TLF67706.1 hypothetical protein FEK33_17525 [Nocardia asteroides NBRC 15531]UGT50728.1 hypothetical protein LT345_09380 [Nocardia asteroides]GAD83376.1 hypothetical protein NCAST_19_00780 [Nocardia asteroides NBRC 15531]
MIVVIVMAAMTAGAAHVGADGCLIWVALRAGEQQGRSSEQEKVGRAEQCVEPGLDSESDVPPHVCDSGGGEDTDPGQGSAVSWASTPPPSSEIDLALRRRTPIANSKAAAEATPEYSSRCTR